MTQRKSLYIAAPLFSLAERAFNAKLKAMLSDYAQVFLPQEDGLLLSDLLRRDIPPDDAVRAIFECDVEAVRASDGLLIVLDGRAVDEGAAFELGIAYAANKTCFGLQTDHRQVFAIGHNPMLTGALTKLATDLTMLIQYISDWA
jgi:nucleoside 2-deoxyribosyltransferase